MGCAWLQVLDRPLSYRTAYKGMLINGINNVLLLDEVITKLSVREQTISQRVLLKKPRQALMCEILPVYMGYIFA